MSGVAAKLAESTRACLRLLYPPHCNWCGTSCGAEDQLQLCRVCQSVFVPSRLPPRCHRCAALLPHHLLDASDCVNCRARRLHFSAAVALASYTGQLRAAVLRIKHAREEALAWSLGRLMAQELREALLIWQPHVVIAMPMHWTRRIRRGVNGPDILASCLARSLAIPLANRALRRRRATQPLEDLSHAARAQTLRHAFATRHSKSIRDRRVLLVDDVMTTGATSNSAARALRTAGAGEVLCVVLARTE